MKQKELRQKMPEIADWLDAMVEVFGKESVHGQVRRGLAGEPMFYAEENGHTVGTRIPVNPARCIVWNRQGNSQPWITEGNDE